jgi:site-specific DNA recombinase
MTRVACYARFSTDLQNPRSAEDQLTLCRQFAEKRGWEVVAEFRDEGISGSSMVNRPGIRDLLAHAAEGSFDVMLCEALDRASRDLEDVAAIYKRLAFHGVKIWTVSEGEIGVMALGLKGTMAALYLADVAIKTRRGLTAVVESGRSPTNPAYGYEIARNVDARGERVRGERTVNADEAEVVVRIYRDFAAGHSPQAIAHRLNAERVRSPRGASWSSSAIYGDVKRGTGILANELYAGRLIWNRQRFIKDPTTGKRVTRLNPKAEWVTKDAPELRIVEPALWAAAQARLAEQHEGSAHIRAALHAKARTGRGPKFLFSSLLRCAVCGGAFAIIGADVYGCATAKYRGPSICSNRTTVSRAVVEERLLASIRNDLFTEAGLTAFKEAVRRRLRERKAGRSASDEAARAGLAKAEAEIANIMTAIRAGILTLTTKAALEAAEAEKARLERVLKVDLGKLDNIEVMLPRVADRYATLVRDLDKTVSRDMSRARSIICGLVGGAITLKPTPAGGLNAELSGHYAGLVDLTKENGPSGKAGAEVNLVAGIGFEPMTFRL